MPSTPIEDLRRLEAAAESDGLAAPCERHGVVTVFGDAGRGEDG